MKARSIDLMAEDYTTDHVRNPDELYSGCRYEEDVESSLIEKLFEHDGHIPAADYFPRTPLQPNEFMVLRNGKKSALAAFVPGGLENEFFIRRVNKDSVYGITPRNAEQSFAVMRCSTPRSSWSPSPAKPAPARRCWPWQQHWKPAQITDRSC